MIRTAKIYKKIKTNIKKIEKAMIKQEKLDIDNKFILILIIFDEIFFLFRDYFIRVRNISFTRTY